MSVPPYQDQDPSTPPYGVPAADTGYAEYPAYPPAPPPPPMPYPYLGNPYPPYPPPRPPQTNALAIASLICAFLFAPLGIVFGHLSLSQIKRSGEEGRGLAVAGLVIGYLVTIGTILALVAGVLLFSWAARVVRENTYPDGVGVMRPRAAAPLTPGGGTLPPFNPPATLGAACAYLATATPAVRPVVPPQDGPASPEQPTVTATMETNDGPVRLELDSATAPCTVNSFVTLAAQGFFDETECHRLSNSPTLAALQCGDPTGSGSGGPGYRFANEYPTNQYRPFDPALSLPVTYPRGTVAMANSGPDSNGSQFFIIYRDSKLPPTHTVFGRVDDKGMLIVDKLVSAGVDGGGDDGKPQQPVRVASIRL